MLSPEIGLQVGAACVHALELLKGSQACPGWQAETQESTGFEIAHLYAERERLSAYLEEQHRECAHLTKAAATAKEASAHDLSAAQTQAKEASLAGATMADALRECRQQLALAQQQTIKSAQVRVLLSTGAHR